MIRLRSDCLIIQISGGEQFPCPVEVVATGLIGKAVDWMSPEVIQNVTAAVLHFFREEQDREVVSVAEFSEALESVLQNLGYSVNAAVKQKRMIRNANINDWIRESEGEMELAMYLRLRLEMERLLKNTPSELRLIGLHGCVKRVLRARRWSRRCQVFRDQVVSFMRQCFDEHASADCLLVVKG